VFLKHKGAHAPRSGADEEADGVLGQEVAQPVGLGDRLRSARAERDDAHITVDLLFVKLGYRAQLIMRVVAGLIGAGVVAVLTWRLYLFSGQLDSGGYTTGILRIPLGPVALVGVVGATVFGLAILSNVVVSIRALIRER
jgi:TRAP-type C4-dicarboxylate transport system permease small subunit